MYGDKAPIFCAFNGTQIAKHMVSFAHLPNTERRDLSRKISSWAHSTFSPESAYQQILDDIYA